MATFKVTKGTPVAFRDGAYPTTYPSPHEGELFYNSSSGAFQFLGVAVAAWSTGGALNTGRQQVGGSGDTPASLAFGGIAPARKNETETYNGTAWTEVNNLNTARSMGGCAGQSQTAALAFAGNSAGANKEVKAESWNGTSWTEVGDLSTGRNSTNGAGSSTSALCVSGSTGDPSTDTANVESWDGSSWTEIANVNVARRTGGTGGVSNSSVIYSGGINTGVINNTEVWNGTAWTEVNNLTTARTGNSGFGTVTSALVGGGENAVSAFVALTEVWDGTSWAEGDDYNTAGDARTSGSGSSGNSGLAAGGRVSGNNGFTGTEEWLNAHPLKTIDVS